MIDTDVLLDVALGRSPYADDASRILDAVQSGLISGVVAWHTISNLYYMLSSLGDRGRAREFVRDLSGIVEIAPVDSRALDVALSLDLSDFEDSMQVSSALAGGAEAIVTRNTRDFRNSPLPVIRPSDLELPE